VVVITEPNSTNQDDYQTIINTLDAQLTQALGWYRIAHYEPVLTLCRGIYEAAARIDYRQCMAECRYLQSSAYYFMGDYVLALPLAHEALSLFDELGDKIGQVQALSVLGPVEQQLGDLAAALGSHHSQLALCEVLGDASGQARALNGIAGLHHQQKEYDTALDYCQQALHIYRAQNNREGEAVVLTKCCELCAVLGDYEAALQTGLEAWQIHQKIAVRPPNQTQTLIHLAHAYQGSGRFKQAEDCLMRALEISQQYQLGQHQAEVLSALGWLARARQQPDLAIIHFHSAIDLAQQQSNERLLYEVHQALAELYEEEGNYRQALFYFQRYHTLKETLFNEARETRLQQLEIRYQTEAARQEVTFYRAQTAQVERQRQQDREYFERLNRLKTEMLATTTHDIKSPLASIRISMHMLRRLIPGTAIRHAENIERQVTRITALITDVLELAKLETGRALEMADTDLKALVENVAHDFHTSAQAKALTLNVETLVQVAQTRCDAARIEQVLSNLLSNAVKYTPNGGTICLRLQYNANHWQLSVSDTGLGIPEEDIPHIFEMFYRVQRSDHQAVEGTGLGLAIVKSVIEQHSGTLHVHSTLGAGSTFSIHLPAQALTL
jgi:signal transduction histidine kinase